MAKFSEDFAEFFAKDDIKHLISTDEGQTSRLSSYQSQQDRWDDNDKYSLFQRVISHNSYIVKDKIVLDLRCGLGLLSVLAARAGAKKVYAVDSSSSIDLTKQLVERNALGNIIEVIKSKVYDLQIPEKSIDVIICDWVGNFVINEESYESVVYAKDKFLKEGGIVSLKGFTRHCKFLHCCYDRC